MDYGDITTTTIDNISLVEAYYQLSHEGEGNILFIYPSGWRHFETILFSENLSLSRGEYYFSKTIKTLLKWRRIFSGNVSVWKGEHSFYSPCQ